MRAALGVARGPADAGLVAGRYDLRRHLGSGGSAAVYLGHDRRLDRDVAVKLLRPEYAADPSFVERFRREARAAAALNDPHVVAIYDFGFTSDALEGGRADTRAGIPAVPYITMEYVAGSSLKDVLRRRGPLPEAEALDIGAQIAAALEAAHARGVIHRDIKPHNVLVDDCGWVKVADFGLARATSAAQLTQTSIVLGTPYYLSPEQAQGRAVDFRSDLYSLGVVLYELLTGRVPFSGESPLALAWQHVHVPPRPVRALRPDVSPRTEAVVMQALAKDPAQRYQSGAAMRQALEQAQVRGLAAAPPAAARPPLRAVPARFIGVEALQPLATPSPPEPHPPLPPRPSAPPVALRPMPAAPVAGARGWASVRLAGWLAVAAVSLASALALARPGGPLALLAIGPSVAGARHEAALPPPAAHQPESVAPAAPPSAASAPAVPVPDEQSAADTLADMGQAPAQTPAETATAPAAVPTTSPPTSQPAPPASEAGAPTAASRPAALPPAPAAPAVAMPSLAAVAAAPAPPPAPVVAANAPLMGAASPAQAVTLFYQLVAQHQFGSAIGLWSARMQANFPPAENVVGRFSQTQQVTVRRAEVIALDPSAQRATVAVDVVETGGAPPAVRHWVGTWQLVRGPTGWLLDQPNLAPS